MVWLKLQLSRLIVADAPTAFDLIAFPQGQPGMPFQLLFGSAPCAQDNLSADVHHLIALQEHAQYEQFLCLKRWKKDDFSSLGACALPSQRYAIQNKFGLSPFLEGFPAQQSRSNLHIQSPSSRDTQLLLSEENLILEKNRTSCFTSLKLSSQLTLAKTVVSFSPLFIVSRDFHWCLFMSLSSLSI